MSADLEKCPRCGGALSASLRCSGCGTQFRALDWLDWAGAVAKIVLGAAAIVACTWALITPGAIDAIADWVLRRAHERP